MSRSRFALPALAFAVLATAAPASAQTPLPATPAEDPLDARDARRVERMEKVVRELRGIVFQMRDTGKPVVVQPADTDARMEEMSSRIADLEQTLRRLNGTLETTTFELDQAKRDNAALKTQVQGLSEKLATLEQPAAAPADTGGAMPAAPAGDPTEAFTRARQLMLAGDYDGAEAAFSSFVTTYPDAQRTPEARYWWGKTLSVRGAHADAAPAYLQAIRGWPQTSWAPDAVVELARSLVALKKPQDACRTLAELPKRYPKAPANITSRAAATRTQAKCAA
jgi:tol-pal system protein YbgF